MSQQESNLSNLVEQMKKFVDTKNDVDKSLFTPVIMKMCLRCKEYDVEKAFRFALKYCKRIEQKIQIESKEKLMQALDSSIIRVSCNKASLRGETIILFDLSSWNPKELDEELIPCAISIVLDYLLRNELFQINGCFILFDITGFKLKHLSQIRKKLIKKILNAFQCTTPLKTINKLFIITQVSSLSQMVFLKFLKKSISKELREKTIILKRNELAKLADFIDANSLSFKYEGRLNEMKMLNLPILINEALDYMPNYSFEGGVTAYCSQPAEENSQEHDTDNETLNENLSKDVDHKVQLDSPDKQEHSEQSTSGLNN